MSTTMSGRYASDFPSKTELSEEGIWGEEVTTTGLRNVVWRRPLPMQYLRQYAGAAARRATARQLDDGTWLASIEGFEGVWANAPSQRDALDEIEEVVQEWVILKIRDEDRDFPVLDGFDLNAL